MFKLNQRGVVLSGVFYGVLLLFLFIVLGIIMVLGNGRLALKTAKNNAINELNSKDILLQGVVLDDANTTDGGSYLTNGVDKELLNLTITLADEVSNDTETTVLVTFYNSTNEPHVFKGLKYYSFNENDIKKYPELKNFQFEEEFDVYYPYSYYGKTIEPFSYMTLPLTFYYYDLDNVTTNTFNTYLLFNFTN